MGQAGFLCCAQGIFVGSKAIEDGVFGIHVRRCTVSAGEASEGHAFAHEFACAITKFAGREHDISS